MADNLLQRLSDAGITAQTEGRTQGDWVLVDAGDAIVHIFRAEVRAFYQLDKLVFIIAHPSQVPDTASTTAEQTWIPA